MFQLTGVFGPAVDEAAAAAEHARRAGDRALLTQAQAYGWWALLFGPADRATTEAGLTDLEADDVGPAYKADATGVRAVLAARIGLFDEARSLFREMRDLYEQLGLETVRESTAQWAARLELDADRPADAASLLRRSRDELERLGERAYRSTVTAFLATALYAEGRHDEAEQIAEAAERESAAEDSVNFALAHGVRARVAADRGDLKTAQRLAESAVGYTLRMDLPLARADALCTSAHVLRVGGKAAEAQEAFDQAIAMYERKGEMAAANQARRVFDRTAAASDPVWPVQGRTGRTGRANPPYGR
jgi:tetratricopeptide (TPR) repeat protein